ncbi:stalk domain-containing protein [Paenibacillus yanchengensis]|uniref:Stalk domain-containing protein n=1 Tax=Paenibacillus yanchengensis TaxID=2035833 RepID=A0ABW4YMQ4_9BACL
MKNQLSILSRYLRTTGKKAIVVTLGAVVIVQTVGTWLPQQFTGGQAPYVVAAASLQKKQESVITAGAKRYDYTFTTKRGKSTVNTSVHVIEVNLTNPHVSLNTISGKNNQVAAKNTILNMVKDNNAVAGINGDVYVMSNEGAPLGAQITSGSLLSTPSRLQGMYAFGVTKDRIATIDTYAFEGAVTAVNGATFPLTGINQSAYVPELGGTINSHSNAMFIYTSAWNGAERPAKSGTTPTEVLVVDGIIQNISSGTPLQDPIPANGYILRSHGEAAKFVQSNLQIGDALTSTYSLKSATSGKAVDPSSFEMMIGGHTILVDQGKAAKFSRNVAGVSGNSYTSRSAVGYSKDGKKVYLITSERNGSNTGLSLSELQKVMVELGVFKGINLDGGGSTTMIDRSLGHFAVTQSHPVQQGSMRSVANGIGVFTSAPQGKLEGMLVAGDATVLIGQSTELSLKGYDNYYNPLDMSSVAVKWSADAAIGKMNGNQFVATKAGQGTITATANGVKQKHSIEVVGAAQIDSMKLNVAVPKLEAGNRFEVPVVVTLKNGKTYNVNGDQLEWEFIGFKGKFEKGAIHIQSVDPKAESGYVIARYDGFGAMLPVVKGESAVIIDDFENNRNKVTAQVVPKGVTSGNAQIVTKLPADKAGKGLEISYDFSQGTGTRASYAAFGDNGGIVLPGTPTALTMDVYSDSSNNWLRAEVIDANNKLHYLDIAKKLDWSGWKNVRADLPASGLAYPLKLKRVYVVTVDKAVDPSKAASGQVYIDNMKVLSSTVVAQTNQAKIELTLGKKEAAVNGSKVSLDAAPVLKGNSTYVPLRFISEMTGADVKYDNKQKRVTIIHGSNFIEMYIGKKEYVHNGKRLVSKVAPYIENTRTLAPLRFVSEQLGLKVGFNNATKKITIQ